MNDFGKFLYELRKEKGMTQAELAAALGVTNRAVSKWETGDAMPETSLLLPIARIFGVSVDELLDGKRRDGGKENGGDNDGYEVFDPQKHLFTRGKDDGPKKLSDIICGALCASTVLLGLAAFLIIGIITDLWHPFWVIIPVCAMLCGIIGIVFELCDADKRRIKRAKGENPITGAICGILMLVCIIVYLPLGAFLSLWHPCWIILAGGAVCCGIIGALGSLYLQVHKK